MLIVPVPPPELAVDVDVFEQPTAVIAAKERRRTSKAPQRRRRGNVNRSTHASAAPDPAAYQGVRPEGVLPGAILRGLLAAAAEVVKAAKTNEVATPLAELTVTGETLKLGVPAALSLFVATTLTVPVNPLTGVIVKDMPVEVEPGCTVTVPLQGVMEKSGAVAETISTDAIEPLG